MGVIGVLAQWFLGGGIAQLTGQLQKAYELKLRAQTDEQKLAADLDLQRIQAGIAAMQHANDDRWSATSIGRYLIVVPFGCWWTMVFIDSIFGFEWDVLALPPDIMELSAWLVPTIVVGDIGRSFFRRSRV